MEVWMIAGHDAITGHIPRQEPMAVGPVETGTRMEDLMRSPKRTTRVTGIIPLPIAIVLVLTVLAAPASASHGGGANSGILNSTSWEVCVSGVSAG